MPVSKEQRESLWLAAKVTNQVLQALNKKGLGARIDASANSGSYYIRFEDNRLGTVRISNHEQKGWPLQAYKYHVRVDINPNIALKAMNSKKVVRFVYGHGSIGSLVRRIKNKSREITTKRGGHFDGDKKGQET